MFHLEPFNEVDTLGKLDIGLTQEQMVGVLNWFQDGISHGQRDDGWIDEFSKELLLQASQHLGQFHFACFHWIIKPSDHWNILGWDVTHGLFRIILFDWLIDWESSFPPPQPWRQGWPDAGHGHQPFRGPDIARSGEGARIGIGKRGGSSMLFQDNWVKMTDMHISYDILYDLHSYIAFHLPFLGCQDPHWESMICIDCFERFALDIRLVGSFPQKVVLFWEAWKLPDPLFGTGSAAWRQGLFGLVGNFKGVVDWKQLNSWREKDKLIRMIVFFAKTFFNENNKDHIHYHTLFICIYIYLRIFVILRITCLCKPSCEKPCAKKIFEVC